MRSARVMTGFLQVFCMPFCQEKKILIKKWPFFRREPPSPRALRGGFSKGGARPPFARRVADFDTRSLQSVQSGRIYCNESGTRLQ